MLDEVVGMVLKASPWVKFVHIAIFTFPLILIGFAAWLDITEKKK
jgi:hypothetical protein